jgi:hypothetical protein
MQPDPALAGETRDSRQLLRVKRLPRHPPHRRFDRDRADRNGDAHPRCAGGSSLDFRQADRRTAGRERHKREAAQRLRAITLVVPQMAFCLNQHASSGACQEPHRKMVG